MKKRDKGLGPALSFVGVVCMSTSETTRPHLPTPSQLIGSIAPHFVMPPPSRDGPSLHKVRIFSPQPSPLHSSRTPRIDRCLLTITATNTSVASWIHTCPGAVRSYPGYVAWGIAKPPPLILWILTCATTPAIILQTIGDSGLTFVDKGDLIDRLPLCRALHV